MAESNKISDRGVVNEEGILRVAEYDRVGELRLMDHLVRIEAANVWFGRDIAPDPVPTDLRRTVVEPK